MLPPIAPLDTLNKHLLVAAPTLNDTPFAQAVIFLAHHGPEGSMGFVINHPLSQLGFTEVARSMGIEELMAQGRQQPIIFRGGPMENTRGFVLHSTEYALQGSVKFNAHFTLSAQADIVNDIALGRGPQHMNFCLGYAGWGPGQLEEELKGTDWLLTPATPDLVFQTPPLQRYEAATRAIGFNPLYFHPEVVGRA